MSATGEAPGRLVPRPPASASARRDGAHAGPAWSGEAGTTLIEAMVVMAITVAVGAIAFPAMEHGVARAVFAEAATGVRADLRMARAQALRTGEPVEIQVAEDGHSYGWTPGPQRALLAGVAMSPVGAAVYFYPDGSARAGSGLALAAPLQGVAGANGRLEVSFRLDPVTGLVEAPR